jgi:hypothetical protein
VVVRLQISQTGLSLAFRHRKPTHHVFAGTNTSNSNPLTVQGGDGFPCDESHLDLADPAEIIDEQDDFVFAIVLERDEAAFLVRRRSDVFQEAGDELGSLGQGNRQDARLVVDTHPDLDVVCSEMSLFFFIVSIAPARAGDAAMSQTDAARPDVSEDTVQSSRDGLEVIPSLCHGPSQFVHEHGPCQPAPSDDGTLRTGHRDVVSDYDERDGKGWIRRAGMFESKCELKHISGAKAMHMRSGSDNARAEC